MITTQQLFPLKQFSTESSESFSPTPPHTETSMGAMFGETVGYTSSPRKPKRRMNEDRLGPFTDYSSRRRPPFQRAITIAAPGSAGHEFSIIRSGNNINQLASDFSSQIPSGRRDSKTSLGSRGKRKESIGLASDLYNRRKMKALNKFKEADTPLKTKRSKGGRVTFSDPPSKEPSPIPPVKTVSTDRDYSKLESTPVRNTDEPVAVRSGKKQISPPMSIPQPAGFLRVALPPTSLPNIPSSSAVLNQINPIVTPNRSDYTTITDEIDTTGLNYSSPSTSPTTPKGSFFRGLDVDVDLYTKKGFPEKDVIQSELEQLRMAEDAEHEQMELMIMKRMRQISLTESESLSDIARHVIQELESDEDQLGSHAPEFHSDEDLPVGIRSGTVNESDGLPHITRGNSEPNINRLGGSLEREIYTNSGASGSVSPPPTGKFNFPQRSSTLEDTSQKANETAC